MPGGGGRAVSAPTQVVIPVKKLSGALRRLSPVLSPAERSMMQEAMLRDMLAACGEAGTAADVLIVSSDPTAAACADAAGARHLPDHDPPRGINAAVAVGQRDARDRGHRALVLTADLALIEAADIAALVATPTRAPAVVLVPSHLGTGTNALLLDAADVIATRLGTDSRARHRAAAAAAGCAYRETTVPRIGLDIDTPADLRTLIAAGAPRHTAAVCRALGLSDRLDAAVGA